MPDLTTIQLDAEHLDWLIRHHWTCGWPSHGLDSAWHREIFELLTGREWAEERPGRGEEVSP